ncbi:MAG: 50S ribosomal protein L24 [Proteobacteria bacterium]|nr:MAG: 50S ribosomal protein L24 [Pseudomonadota bacterium]
MALGIRKGDLVRVTKGADRGKTGRVLAVDAERGRVRVEKVRIQKRHVKPGRRAARAGGIVEQEGFIDVSNVMLVDGQGKPSRLRTATQEGRRVRVFATTGERVPEPAAS